MQTTFEFTLPHGYIDDEGTVHQTGVMRLSRAIDEIVPLRDPRVQANPAYATVIILARVIERLGTLPDISPSMVENFFAGDLSYLQDFYRHINKLEERPQPSKASSNPIPSPAAANPTATNGVSSPAANAVAANAVAANPVSEPGAIASPPSSFVPQPAHPNSLADAINMTMGVQAL